MIRWSRIQRVSAHLSNAQKSLWWRGVIASFFLKIFAVDVSPSASQVPRIRWFRNPVIRSMPCWCQVRCQRSQEQLRRPTDIPNSATPRRQISVFGRDWTHPNVERWWWWTRNAEEMMLLAGLSWLTNHWHSGACACLNLNLNLANRPSHHHVADHVQSMPVSRAAPVGSRS